MTTLFPMFTADISWRTGFGGGMDGAGAAGFAGWLAGWGGLTGSSRFHI
jgi:hypothetical protein